MLICQSYKAEIGQHWRFNTVEIAADSSQKIYQIFLDYVRRYEFVGADMARKYLQMGYTRARRYANYSGGKKYNKEKGYEQLQRGTGEVEKARAASIFYEKYKPAESHPVYKTLKSDWKKQLD